MKNKLQYFRLDELVQAIQSKAQPPTIGCQLARKTATELSPSGLLRVKRRGGQVWAELVDGWLLADKVHTYISICHLWGLYVETPCMNVNVYASIHELFGTSVDGILAGCFDFSPEACMHMLGLTPPV